MSIGRYRVLRVLGEGAMGRVLLAHDPVLDREVALKHLRDDLRIPRDVREGLVVRMRHEARAAARVAHPNIVTLHDMGEDPGLGLYLVFEYVEGPTLKDRLREGPLTPHQAARLARELGEALTLAHRAGVVHRDVKPENIILSSTGGKVADFGIARVPDSTLTHQGGLMGTPAYSAPETFRAGKFSSESDQFSLAAVMYEATSGERAFPGDDAVTVTARIAHEAPEPIGERLGSMALDEVLSRGLAKRPEDRFPSCEAFGRALASALEGHTLARAAALANPPLQVPPSSPSSPSFGGRASEPRSQPGHALIGSGMLGALDAMNEPEPRVPNAPLPRDRKLGQVILGGAVVVVTATLLLRTALRSVEGSEVTPEGTASSSAAAPSATAAPRPRTTPTARPTRPKVEHAAGAGTSAQPASELDAGVDPDASARPGEGAAQTDGADAGQENDAGTAVDAGGAGTLEDLRER
ncbi:serine/threonine protein kinase [Chondromyces apiculatus DSM 436]|uniref:Serine/threonine protein kinase n=1 Tax=Chondromyces apiculatus DSM 436 TaxID=1192034 RepID=A0A017T2H7_9BACT|nr:serine/threonine protein kinase [Chondromyces apiculatus DSM 436]